MADDIGATVNEWVNIVRRARLDRTTKLVALMLASYANPDGTKVYPGLARLVVQCGISYRGAQYALQKLRDAELIEVVRRGNRRRGRSDEYRLVLGANLLDRVQVPSPDEERVVIDAAASKRRGTGRKVSRDSHVTINQAQPTAHEEAIRRNQGPRLGATTAPPPSIGPLPKNKPSIHSADKSSGPTDVGRDSARAGPTDVVADLALGNGWKKYSGNYDKPWAELQERYDNEEVGDFEVIELIGLSVGWELDLVEQRTVAGMLANGAHLKTIANTIKKRGAA